MINDKRKALRRPIRYTAWLALGPDDLHGCVLSDISDTGARLDIDDSKEIPDNFMLWLSSSGLARRKCKVVWRKPRQIGVSFARRINDTEHATLVPLLDGDHGPILMDFSEESEPAEGS